MKKAASILICAFIALSTSLSSQVSWMTKGNAGLSTNHYIGTNDAIPLTFRTNSVTRGVLSASSNFSLNVDSIFSTNAKNYARILAITNSTNSTLSQAQIQIKSSAGLYTVALTAATFSPQAVHYNASSAVHQYSVAGETDFINKTNVPFIFTVNGADSSNSAFKITATGCYIRRTGKLLEQVPSIEAVSTVTATSPNRTLKIVYGGTTYYIHAKTTND